MGLQTAATGPSQLGPSFPQRDAWFGRIAAASLRVGARQEQMPNGIRPSPKHSPRRCRLIEALPDSDAFALTERRAPALGNPSVLRPTCWSLGRARPWRSRVSGYPVTNPRAFPVHIPPLRLGFSDACIHPHPWVAVPQTCRERGRRFQTARQACLRRSSEVVVRVRVRRQRYLQPWVRPSRPGTPDCPVGDLALWANRSGEGFRSRYRGQHCRRKSTAAAWPTRVLADPGLLGGEARTPGCPEYRVRCRRRHSRRSGSQAPTRPSHRCPACQAERPSSGACRMRFCAAEGVWRRVAASSQGFWRAV